MAFLLPQGPPPAFGASVRYQYHTLDGGPPNEGKPPGPAAPGAPPPYSPYPFCTAPAAPPPGPAFPFCTPQGPAPAPTTFCCNFNDPLTTPGGPPSIMCWAAQPPQPPQPPKPLVVAASPQPPVPPSRFVTAAGPSRSAHPPDPGNRVNNRIVKADDGTGVICPEDMTTFHVLNPGRWFDENITVISLQSGRDFKVQHVPSEMSVHTFIERLGGLNEPRVDAEQVSLSKSLICIEQWHETGDGKFQRGSNVFYDEHKALTTLKGVGWGPEHGKAGQQPPIWVMLYPINNKLAKR